RMSRLAVDHMYTLAAGFNISEKGPALITLAAHHDKRSIPLTTKFLKSKNLTLIKSALQAAEILKVAELEEEVVNLLSSPMAMIRLHAMESAFKLRLPNLEDKLEGLLKDPVWYIRERLPKLINIHNLAQHLLPTLLNDSSHPVRQIAKTARKNHIQPA
ncbi:MAG: hypothetical protein HRT88_11815, partial [Lentisphaeraceae bacterium]|nr:hypothetical protein [Lentisphaeraceae bacterium]